jgi:prophage maintenance system killer protein
VKKRDSHKVISHEKISCVIEATRQQEGDVYDKATTLLIGLVKGHAFDSGNRRTAVAVTELFLEANGAKSNLKHDPKSPDRHS